MRLTFYGGAAEVTGSATLLEHKGLQILIDCGAFQGGRGDYKKNLAKFPFNPRNLAAVILTHAHFDHSGRLPKLMAEGFRGDIFMTAETKDLIGLLLADSLHVMENEYRESGKLPFFNLEQLNQMLSRVKTVKYGQVVNSGRDLSFVLHNAGHVLGSASVEMRAGGKKILFTGDLGSQQASIIKHTERPHAYDYLVMESTYAMRAHEPAEDGFKKLEKALVDTIRNKGVLLIPAFALERTEEVIWHLHLMADKNKLPKINFYLDSPLAIHILDIFKNYKEDYGTEAAAEAKKHHDFLNFPGLVRTLTVPESKGINNAPAPKVIIAGSGMMQGGRIMYHLYNYLPLKNTTVLVVGYQAEGTLGRKIATGHKEVRIFDHFIPVNAKVVQIDSFSAHADHNELVDFVKAVDPAPKFIFLNHGDPQRSKDLAIYFRDKLGLRSAIPRFGQSVEI